MSVKTIPGFFSVASQIAIFLGSLRNLRCLELCGSVISVVLAAKASVGRASARRLRLRRLHQGEEGITSTFYIIHKRLDRLRALGDWIARKSVVW